MAHPPSEVNRRVLVIDDNRAIHEDFAKILCRDVAATAILAQAEAEIFGEPAAEPTPEVYELDSAFQGEEGLARVREALAGGRPYALAFIDVRMPPGWDGIETAMRIWQIDPQIQIVICTAYSDYSWSQMRAKLGKTDRLVVLKKPFDNIEVLQLADGLTRKWQRAHEGNRHLASLQQMIRDRSNELTKTSGNRWQIGELENAAQFVDTVIEEHLVLENELRAALEAGAITVHYQPLIDVRTKLVTSIEALVRWHHPTKGWIPPARFVPIAEESDLILALGELVLATACREIARWQTAGLPVVPVAVNLSAKQLQKQNIVQLVRSTMAQTGIRPQLLALELTESALIENVEQQIQSLHALRGDGVSIEIDDFGTGYSSLSYLKQLPVDTLKIDRSFIKQIDKNSVDEAIVSAIVAMAHSLQLRVVAEGVETEQQMNVVRAHGCDVAQGYLFSKPLPAEECAAFIAKTNGGGARGGLRLVARTAAR